ncbi:tRNA epoxyqueuosine(34) reductase QueG [Petroclostridium sp. X23]|uniref:tRNA epoxyqueuosine(34) reductase QueG n=1 Tax=Petroclostridium sp. X23 TaxID=3045146 RepID=UPI0024AE2BB1|nr:tRNA epoxyqueuosine(34) reductase QueG [Petroclostridium sp. X23]WHH61542.1 tRNA epoxyqueuosine(34) reductase QueG [Petroclostridium sp. X23]
MKEKLKEFCKDIGIEAVGIAPPGPYHDLEAILTQRIGKGYYTGMEEKDLEKRISPCLTMENVQSVIVCLFPYLTDAVENSNISKYTYSIDYHLIIQEKLQKIGEFLKGQIKGFEYLAFVDNGPLVDRYLAYMAGLGYFGLNNSIITEKYGSYVFIGYILNNYLFEFDRPLDKQCAQCEECLKRCPGNALLGNYQMDPTRCASYITQKKEDLSKEEIKILKRSGKIFGCDICQQVCPHNKHAEKTNLKEFGQDTVYNISKEDVESYSNKGFKKRYGNRAFSWRGKKIILRNLNVINEKNND